MAKREKFSIWGGEPSTKGECYNFFQERKKLWFEGYILQGDDEKYMKEMMSKYYYTPLEQAKHLVQDVWHKNKDKIIEIKVVLGPVFGEKTFEFWIEKPTYTMSKTIGMVDGKISCTDKEGKPFLMETIDSFGKMFNFSTARCICFPGQTGLTHESAKPKSAVMEALKNAIAQPKIQWKKDQGYRPRIDPRMDAHHVDGKEFKTIFLKFVNTLKISEEEFYQKIYPEHGNYETNLLEYVNITGWQFKNNFKANTWRETWFNFHEKYREYEMVDPVAHHKLSSDEIKFKTSIRKNVEDLLK